MIEFREATPAEMVAYYTNYVEWGIRTTYRKPGNRVKGHQFGRSKPVIKDGKVFVRWLGRLREAKGELTILNGQPGTISLRVDWEF